jgi:catechol 2,3-dioxygenase-like lactoylglutathione lyase family enzyme
MYDHIGFKVSNLDASVRFYGAALAPLGFVLCSRDESSAGFGPAGAPALWLQHNPQPAHNGTIHIAFHAADRAAVERFHAGGIACGARDNGAPGLRTDYSPRYYAAFLIDPDGNNVEAVCMKQEDA